jgi:hypothetical protein
MTIRTGPFFTAMRALVAIAGLLVGLGPSPVRAEHGDPLLIPAPAPGATIPRNARIRLESRNGIGWQAEGLGLRRPGFSAALVAADHEVGLRVESFFDDQEGGYGAGLLVLAPVRLLTPATSYRLEIRYPVEGGGTGRWAEWSWTTSRVVDRAPPRWRAAPRGRGPGEIVAGLAPEAPVVELVADLQPVGRGTRKRLRMVLDGSRACNRGPTVDYNVVIVNASCPASRGAEQCQTAHWYQSERDVGRRFRVTLTAVDLAGNRRRAPGVPPIVRWPEDQSLTICLRP